MGRPQTSVTKRLRERAKREKKQLKAEKRAQRKLEQESADPNQSGPPIEADTDLFDWSESDPLQNE